MNYLPSNYIKVQQEYILIGGQHGHDCMVVGFTTTYAISAYHH